MSKRAKARKERREQEKREFWMAQRETQRAKTAWVRRWAARIGLAVAGLAVLGGLVWGGMILFQSFAPMAKISGPFGSISRAELAENKFVTLHTNLGDIKMELDTKLTPKTSANFVLLAQKDYFDGIKFHRVIKDFMIQSGDPNSKDDDPSNDGTGGPGYQFNDEKIVGEYTRGTVAMANAGPNTNGSQFFIVLADTELPKNYTIFGKVVEGMDAVDAIGAVPVEEDDNGEASRPKTAVVIEKVSLSNT